MKEKKGFSRLNTDALANRAKFMHKIKRSPGLRVKSRKGKHKRGEKTAGGWMALDEWGRIEYNPENTQGSKIKKYLITANPLEKLPSSLEGIIAHKKKEGREFQIIEKGNVRYLYERGRLSAFAYYINKEKAAKMISSGSTFWGEGISFSSGMGAYIALSKEIRQFIADYERKHKASPKSSRMRVVRYRNQEVWKTLKPGDRFHALDLNNCWFQMCYRLGYITEDTYSYWKTQREYKNVLRRFMPMLASTKAYYRYKGKKIIEKGMDPFSLACKALYDNIRAEASKYMEELIEILGNSNVVYANTDEIAVLVGDENAGLRKTVADFFKERNLEYKVALCRKIDQDSYQHGEKIKKWVIKRG